MTTRLLYKYRGLEPWPYLLDILINQRLHAAKFHQLNDPMEGIFYYGPDELTRTYIDSIVERKGALGICALSKVYNSTLMWSYYASAHQGIVLGVEIDPINTPGVYSIDDVKYVARSKCTARNGADPHIEAKRILSRKLTSWKHEEEVRVFAHSTYISITIRELYLGCKMDNSTRQMFRRLIQNILPDVDVHQMDINQLDRPIRRYDT